MNLPPCQNGKTTPPAVAGVGVQQRVDLPGEATVIDTALEAWLRVPRGLLGEPDVTALAVAVYAALAAVSCSREHLGGEWRVRLTHLPVLRAAPEADVLEAIEFLRARGYVDVSDGGPTHTVYVLRQPGGIRA